MSKNQITNPIPTSKPRSLFEGALRQGQNAFYGVADYLVQGFAMLAAAGFLVHRLGLSQYGLWMLASAFSNAMETLSSGFGDATIKFVSKYRGLHQPADVERVVRTTLTINGGLGAVLAALVILFAPFAANHVFKIEPQHITMSIRMLQVAGIIMLARSVENVYANTLRAFERYGSTVKISATMRTLNVVAAVVLAYLGQNVLTIMWASLILAIASVALQAYMVRSVCGHIIVAPSSDLASLREISSFGLYSWFQALAGVIFNNADRMVVEALLGAPALAIYSICVQATQPIHGIAAAALNFVFPHASAKHAKGDADALRRVTRFATRFNVGLVFVLSAPLIIFSRQILTIWMGAAFADRAHGLLILLAIANACLGTSVTAHYVLLAMGNVKFVSLVNVLGGVFSLLCVALLLPRYGIIGAAIGRLLYAAAAGLDQIKLQSIISAISIGQNE